MIEKALPLPAHYDGPWIQKVHIPDGSFIFIGSRAM